MVKLMVLMPGKMCATTQQKSVRPVMVWFVIASGYLRREREREVGRERRMDRRWKRTRLYPHLRGKQMARYRSRPMVSKIREFREPK